MLCTARQDFRDRHAHHGRLRAGRKHLQDMPLSRHPRQTRHPPHRQPVHGRNPLQQHGRSVPHSIGSRGLHGIAGRLFPRRSREHPRLCGLPLRHSRRGAALPSTAVGRQSCSAQRAFHNTGRQADSPLHIRPSAARAFSIPQPSVRRCRRSYTGLHTRPYLCAVYQRRLSLCRGQPATGRCSRRHYPRQRRRRACLKR